MNRRFDRLLIVLAFFGLAAVFSQLQGCGPSTANHDQALIKATSLGIQGAAAALSAWDLEHQEGIADDVRAKGGGYPEYDARVKVYRASRADVTLALQNALASVKQAMADPSEDHLAMLALSAGVLYQKITALGLTLDGVK